MSPWNWELPHWPQFTFDPDQIAQREKQFLLGIGSALAYLKTIEEKDYAHFIVEILSMEGLESSRIEGEILDRESLQSSIRQHFGIQTTQKRRSDKETAMAAMLCNVYETFDKPLTHEMLWKWHAMLFDSSSRIDDRGAYRTHPEPMQIVSNRYDSPVIFFEAPPSSRVFDEMTKFISWFNSTNSSGSILGRAAIAHIYFESIHPFEDGNGRIGRVLIEKVLSQGVGRPVLIAISKMLEKRKKEYYSALEKCNRTLDVHHWVEFFSSVILQAHEESLQLLYFLIEKSRMLNILSGQINPRQTKVLLRMFEEGPNGFKGGLSAENYITITKTTRPTATRDLADLVDKGALIKTGELRHTRYYLNLKRN
ncbi:MAG: Fic family protein [Verrucomicrobia bacterium]|nr:Fic family protein [Verrucomicrobiota bacterium]